MTYLDFISLVEEGTSLVPDSVVSGHDLSDELKGLLLTKGADAISYRELDRIMTSLVCNWEFKGEPYFQNASNGSCVRQIR